jgi:hypothetical protein
MNNATSLPLISNTVATAEEKKHEKAVDNTINKLPYSETILEPTKVQGVKIPDGSTISSAVATIINNYQFSISTTGATPGVGGFLAGYKFYTGDTANPASLVPNAANGSSSGDNYLFGITNNVGSAGPTDPYKPWSNSPIRIYSNGFQGSSDFMPNYASSVRLVSMEVEVTTLGSNFTNQGEIIYGYIPPYVLAYYANGSVGGTTNLTTQTLKDIPGMRFEPIAMNKCWSARYCPMDPRAFMYLDMDDITFPRPDEWDRGAFVVAVTGGSTTQTLFDVKTTANYEYIPVQAGLSFSSATPCQSDPVGMSLALNSVRQKDTTRTKASMSDNNLTPLSSAAAMYAPHNKPNVSPNCMNLPVVGFITRRPILYSGPVTLKNGVASNLATLLGPSALNMTYKLFSNIIGGKNKNEKQQHKQKQQNSNQREPKEKTQSKPVLQKAVEMFIAPDKKGKRSKK